MCGQMAAGALEGAAMKYDLEPYGQRTIPIYGSRAACALALLVSIAVFVRVLWGLVVP